MSVELRGIPRIIAIAGVLAAPGRHARAAEPPAAVPSPDYAGAASCRACHEPFYELWATSRHGTAMQPFTVALFQERMKPQAAPLALGDRTYRFETDDSAGWVRETTPDGETKHAVAYVLGGKNVDYLLTGLDRGRLQILPAAVDALLAAAGDDRRVVRIHAGAALAGKEHSVDDAALSARVRRAQGEFEAAERLDPRSVPARINAALAYNLLGENAPAEEKLRAALQLAPDSAAAWLNLGLLLGETERRDEAITALRTALKADPASAVAAYNLGVLLADSDRTAAIGWCEKAATLAPAVPKYAYTLAYFQQAGSSFDAAAVTLEKLIERHPSFADAHLLLGRIHVEGGDPQKAHAVFARAAAETALPENARRFFAAQAEALKTDEK